MILEGATKVIDIINFQAYANADDYPNIDKDCMSYTINWYKGNGNWYYFKHLNLEEKIVSELLGSYIAKYFNLPTVNYKVGKLKDHYGLLSQELCKNDCLFLDKFLWDKYDYNLVNFLDQIQRNFQNKNLVREFFDTALVNYFMGQPDFNKGSLVFTGHDESDITLKGVLDFEKARITCVGAKFLESFHTSFYWFDENNLMAILSFFPELQQEVNKLLNLDVTFLLNKIENDYGIVINERIKRSSLTYSNEVLARIKTLKTKIY